jgi:hypothetical protein
MLAFVTTFPGADMSALRKVVPAKLRYLNDLLSGEAYFTINGVREPRSEADAERTQRELEVWEEIRKRLNR